VLAQSRDLGTIALSCRKRAQCLAGLVEIAGLTADLFPIAQDDAANCISASGSTLMRTAMAVGATWARFSGAFAQHGGAKDAVW
jgi:hypothetical protein